MPGSFEIALEYKQPYRYEELLGFFRTRALKGIELVDEDSYARTVCTDSAGGQHIGWMRVRNDEARSSLVVELSDSLEPVCELVCARVRRQFDLDCDPHEVYGCISSLNEQVEGAAVLGTRLPGAFEPFETAVRAVLGQQISVTAAGSLAARVIEAYGTRVETGVEGLEFVFPAPQDVLAIENIESAFGQLGVIKTRSATIAEIARLLVAGELDFTPEVTAPEQIERLVAIKGIGPWTANYIAMRVLGYTDAFLETDVGVKHALPDMTPRERLAFVEQWRPWRSYVNICLWNSLTS